MHSLSVGFLDCHCHHYVQIFPGKTFIYMTSMSGVACSLDLSLWQERKLSVYSYCHSLGHPQVPTEQNFLNSTKHVLESKQMSLYLISGKPWELASVPSSCTKRCLNVLADCNSRKGDNPPTCCLEILLCWLWMQKLCEVERTEYRFLTS